MSLFNCGTRLSFCFCFCFSLSLSLSFPLFRSFGRKKEEEEEESVTSRSLRYEKRKLYAAPAEVVARVPSLAYNSRGGTVCKFFPRNTQLSPGLREKESPQLVTFGRETLPFRWTIGARRSTTREFAREDISLETIALRASENRNEQPPRSEGDESKRYIAFDYFCKGSDKKKTEKRKY